MAIKVANNQSLTAITSIPASITGGAMTLLETKTASSDATLSFTSDIDDTYDEYVFKFYDIHPETDDTTFQVNFRDGGSSYDATKTTTSFLAYHQEDGGDAALFYSTARDLAQSTGVKQLVNNLGGDNDQCASGELFLFNPSSTTFVKHFFGQFSYTESSDQAWRHDFAGYCNVTAAIDGVQFSFSADSIQSGTIKVYGVS